MCDERYDVVFRFGLDFVSEQEVSSSFLNHNTFVVSLCLPQTRQYEDTTGMGTSFKHTQKYNSRGLGVCTQQKI